MRQNKVITKIANNDDCVFACGGGIINRIDNMTILRKNSIIIYLEISAESALHRLKDFKDRPLIDVINRENIVRSLISERKKLYEKYSDIIINCDREEPDKIADMISNELNSINEKDNR